MKGGKSLCAQGVAILLEVTDIAQINRNRDSVRRWKSMEWEGGLGVLAGAFRHGALQGLSEEVTFE